MSFLKRSFEAKIISADSDLIIPMPPQYNEYALSQRILALIKSRREEMALETQTIGMIDALVDDIEKLCQTEVKESA
jgi:hypothetical protein